ncbi:MAG TPA: nucleotidyltransferase domain-containing protein [Bacteroidia bacterium]|jgi:predicted nucleotidyltransferase|nr:nucleotidyltransferase domain-containing protein [Bacteroidia bacterium]
MVTQSIQNTIKSTVRSVIPDARVLLFGSMARGDANKDSDYDVLVIIPNTMPPREKIPWITKIQTALVYALDAPFDVLLNSEEEVKKKVQLPSHIVRTAIDEGVEL